MRFLLSLFLISFLVFYFGCQTTTEENPTVPSSPAKPLEEPEEEVDVEKPQSIVVPVASLGDVSETRKKILQNTLEDELKEHFMLISQERFEEAQEKAFEELDYEECTEDQCIMMIQEMLQVENVFHLEVIGEGTDTQLSLSWRTLDQKKKETDFCEDCKTRKLNEKIGGLVNKLVEVEEEVIVTDRPSKEVEPVVVETPKFVPKSFKEQVIYQKVKPSISSKYNEIICNFRMFRRDTIIAWGDVYINNGIVNLKGKWVAMGRPNYEKYPLNESNIFINNHGNLKGSLNVYEGLTWGNKDTKIYNLQYSTGKLIVGATKALFDLFNNHSLEFMSCKSKS